MRSQSDVLERERERLGYVGPKIQSNFKERDYSFIGSPGSKKLRTEQQEAPYGAKCRADILLRAATWQLVIGASWLPTSFSFRPLRRLFLCFGHCGLVRNP